MPGWLKRPVKRILAFFSRQERLRRRYVKRRIWRLTGASLADYLQFPEGFDERVKTMKGRGLHRDDAHPDWAALR